MESIQSPVLSSRDVLTLITIWNHHPSRSFVSVKGNITAMSEILRMKQDDFFIIEIDFHLYVLVKGIIKPQPILIAWKTSQMTAEPHSHYVSCVIFKEWLSTTTLARANINSPNVNVTQATVSVEKLHHCKGIVTDASKSADGIYVLDNNIRLFVGFIPSGHIDTKVIQEGCGLHIYNVHRHEGSGNILIACSHSLIRCDNHTEETGNQDSSHESREQNDIRIKKSPHPSVKSYIQKYGLNYKEAQATLALKQHIGKSESKNVLKILDNIFKSEICETIFPTGLSPIDLFVQHERLCPAADDHMSRNRIPCLQTVNHLKHLALRQDSKASVDCQGSNKQSSNWSFSSKKWEDEEILLGSLNPNRLGQLEFVDETGKIPIVLSHGCCDKVQNSGDNVSVIEKPNSSHKRNTLRTHFCDINCLAMMKAREKLYCPFISQSVIGKTIVCKQYRLVHECLSIPLCHNTEMLDKHLAKIKSEEMEESQLTYLLISLLDCIFLEKDSSKSCSVNDHAGTTISSGKFTRFTEQSGQSCSCLIHISAKESLVSSFGIGSNFTIIGDLINNDALELFMTESCASENNGSASDSCRTECAENLHHIGKRSSRLGNNLEEKMENKRAKDDLCIAGHEDEIHSDENSCDRINQETHNIIRCDTGVMVKGQLTNFDTQPVTLLISGHGVSSYPFLSVKKIYALKILESENGFKPMFSNARVGATLLRSNSRVFLDIKEKLVVERAIMKTSLSDEEVSAFRFETSEVLTVSDVLKQSDTGSIVSFRGVISARESLTSTFTLKGGFGSDDIKVVVSDLEESSVGIHVYFKSFKAFSILGLIPGSVVVFHCVEKKISQQGNLYCKFGSSSSFELQGHIDVYQSVDQGTRTRNKKWDCDNLTRKYLFNIWHQEGDLFHYQPVWCVRCHICIVFTLSLKIVCGLCQGLYLDSGCQSPGCNSSDVFGVKTYASVLVGDGTGQATVKLFTDKLVQKLLTLSDEQWADLMSVAQRSGEIFISKFGPQQSYSLPIEMFVHQLVQSPLVIRPCVMAVKRMRNSPNSTTVAKMNEQDFKVKDKRIGQTTVPVLQLPLLQLECLDLKEVPK